MEEGKTMTVEVDGRSPSTLVCEACKKQCKDPRDLAVHTERHLPVDPPTFDQETRKEISHPCSAGCGRNFVSLAKYRDHAPICDGQAPLPPYLDNRVGRREGLVDCPECKLSFIDLDKMALHMERHREVHPPTIDKATGETLSKPCPKDCGRNFLSKRDYKEHTELCDGSPPILPLLPKKAEEAVVILESIKQLDRTDPLPELDLGAIRRRKEGETMFKCEYCSPARTFSRPGPYSIHLKKTHGKSYAEEQGDDGARSRAGVRKAASKESTPATSRAVEKSTSPVSIGDLKTRAEELRRRADRLDEIATSVDLLMKEAEGLV